MCDFSVHTCEPSVYVCVSQECVDSVLFWARQKDGVLRAACGWMWCLTPVLSAFGIALCFEVSLDHTVRICLQRKLLGLGADGQRLPGRTFPWSCMEELRNGNPVPSVPLSQSDREAEEAVRFWHRTGPHTPSWAGLSCWLLLTAR